MMNSSQVDDPGDRLPVWLTICQSYGIVFRNLGVFMALALLPIVLTFTIQEISRELVIHWEWPRRVRLLLEEPFRWLFWTVFAVAWHRYALLGQRDTTAWIQFRVGWREIRYLFYSAVVAIPLLGARVPTMVLIQNLQELSAATALWLSLMALMAIGLGLVVLIRFSFIFPSVSVERPTGFRRAWKETSGAGWRIFWVTFLASIPIGVIDRLLREVTLAMEPAVTRLGGGYFDNMLSRWMLGTQLAQLIFTFLFTAILVSALSLAFKDRTKWAPGKRVSPATA
tara:strand:- start:763 stop:1611 length:849 start_codon:yes stop_codon:yes gene_type:complete